MEIGQVNAFSIVNQKGNVVRVIREHYLRDDITCKSKACTICKNNSSILEGNPILISQESKQQINIEDDFSSLFPTHSLNFEFARQFAICFRDLKGETQAQFYSRITSSSLSNSSMSRFENNQSIDAPAVKNIANYILNNWRVLLQELSAENQIILIEKLSEEKLDRNSTNYAKAISTNVNKEVNVENKTDFPHPIQKKGRNKKHAKQSKSQAEITKKAEEPSLILEEEEVSNQTIEYIIPSLPLALHFLEIFDNAEWKNLIFCETHVQELQNTKKQLYSRLKQILQNQVRRNAALYSNEHSKATFVLREHGESREARNQRAIRNVAQFYREHLHYSIEVILLVVDEKEQQQELAKLQQGVKVETLLHFLQTRFANNKKLTDQFEALQLVSQQSQQETETFFEEWLPMQALESGISSGLFLKGMVTVNKFNTKEAFFKPIKSITATEMEEEEGDQLQHQYAIIGQTNRNRAIHSDVVAIQVLPESEWISPSKQSKKQYIIKTAKVVGILQRNQKDYVCSVQEQTDTVDNSSSKSEYILCIPLDRRIPKIRIKTRQRKELENDRFIVRLEDWKRDSMYPNGYYVESLGPIGDINTETKALLVEHKLVDNANEFSKLALRELPHHTTEHPFIIPKEEIKKRRDIRNSHFVMSIDPIGCEDIDDALSVKQLPNGNFEFGVHIADVSFFLQHNSPLDLEARKRSTTIYFVDRRLDMLPTLLSANLCSLLQGQDRLAVSVFWEYTPQGVLKNVSFDRVVMKSKYALHYEQAQNIIDGKSAQLGIAPEGKWSEAQIEEKDMPMVKQSLILLTKFGTMLHEKRQSEGAIDLESLDEVKIKLKDNKPVRIITKQDLNIHHTVAEWMIYANYAVARKIYETFPQAALLRRHPFPKQESFSQLIQVASLKGFFLDTSTNDSLAKSLDEAQDNTDRYVNLLLRALTTRAMQEAQYFSTGQYTKEDFYHYGLALHFYTHFTSPIRRYADIIVHRMLISAMQQQPEHLFDNLALAKAADHMNEKNRASKQAQSDSIEWFRSIYFKEFDCIEEAIIYSIKTNQLFVFVPAFSAKGVIHLLSKQGELVFPEKEEALKSVTQNYEVVFDPERLELTLRISTTNKKIKLVNYKIFDHIKVRLFTNESRAHLPQTKMELVDFQKNQFAQDGVTTKQKKISNSQIIEDVTAVKRQQEQEFEDRLYGSNPHGRMMEYQNSSKSIYTLMNQIAIPKETEVANESVLNVEYDKKETKTESKQPIAIQETLEKNEIIKELMSKKKRLEARLKKIEQLKQSKTIGEQEQTIINTETKCLEKLESVSAKLFLLLQ